METLEVTSNSQSTIYVECGDGHMRKTTANLLAATYEYSINAMRGMESGWADGEDNGG